MYFKVVLLVIKNTYIFIDVEAAFINGKQRIIEIGAIKWLPNGEVEQFTRMIKPTKFKKLSTYIQNLTGITTEEVIEGDLFSKVMKDFKVWCGKNPIFVTFGEFDRKILEWEFDSIQLNKDFLYPIVDFQQKYMIEQNVKDQPSLVHLLTDLEIPVENHHRALADAYSLMKVFEALDGESIIEKQQTNDFILVLTEWKEEENFCQCVITYALGSINPTVKIESIQTIQERLKMEEIEAEQGVKHKVIPNSKVAKFLKEIGQNMDHRVLMTRANYKTLSKICRLHECELPKTEFVPLMYLLKELEKVNQFLLNGQSIPQYESRVCQLMSQYSSNIKEEFLKRYLFKMDKITI